MVLSLAYNVINVESKERQKVKTFEEFQWKFSYTIMFGTLFMVLMQFIALVFSLGILLNIEESLVTEEYSDSMYFIIGGILMLTLFVGSFVLGKIIGFRSQNKDILAIVLFMTAHYLFVIILKIPLTGIDELIHHEDRLESLLLNPILYIAMLSTVGIVGVLRARKLKQAMYIGYLFPMLTRANRQDILNLVYEEALSSNPPV